MKKIILLVSLFTVLFASAQTQDSLFVWKAGVMIHKQSIKPADMDSITFKRPAPPTLQTYELITTSHMHHSVQRGVPLSLGDSHY